MPSAWQVADAQEKVLRLLIDRVPNYVGMAIIRQRLSQFDDDTLQAAISALMAQNKITPLPTAHDGSFRVSDLDPYPVRKTIAIGNSVVPRVLSTESINEFPEYFNESVERLSEYTASLESRFGHMLQEQLRPYWATLVSVFGVFVAVLAFVLVSVPKLRVDPSLPWLQIVLVNTAQIIPLAVVLAIFTVALRLVVR